MSEGISLVKKKKSSEQGQSVWVPGGEHCSRVVVRALDTDVLTKEHNYSEFWHHRALNLPTTGVAVNIIIA